MKMKIFIFGYGSCVYVNFKSFARNIIIIIILIITRMKLIFVINFVRMKNWWNRERERENWLKISKEERRYIPWNESLDWSLTSYIKAHNIQGSGILDFHGQKRMRNETHPCSCYWNAMTIPVESMGSIDARTCICALHIRTYVHTFRVTAVLLQRVEPSFRLTSVSQTTARKS